ncbi:hypothetical protein ScalyP_jg3107 [Parmales sp. scaly parma]|nr:hypothetical protein ScalyP_jg3107 [Parmales sp. scaly parma]
MKFLLLLLPLLCTSFSATIPTAPTPSLPTSPPIDDEKEFAKLFGRIADKFILLDASAGLCCYSACADCEFRLPGGGYRMSEQTASRAKWVCTYSTRTTDTKSHTSRWAGLFPDETTKVTKSEFITGVQNLPYIEALGPPFVSKKDATELSETCVARLWDVCVSANNNKETISQLYLSRKLKELAGEEEGLIWSTFKTALDI